MAEHEARTADEARLLRRISELERQLALAEAHSVRLAADLAAVSASRDRFADLAVRVEHGPGARIRRGWARVIAGDPWWWRVIRAIAVHVRLLLTLRWPIPLRGGPLFDADWYLSQYPDLRRWRQFPQWHFEWHGLREGRDPNAYFDTSWYLEQNEDVRAIGLDPVDHYLRYGAVEGRDPGPEFDTDWYQHEYPDVVASGLNPLVHYLRYGRAEGRSIHAATAGGERTDALASRLALPEATPLLHSYLPDGGPREATSGSWFEDADRVAIDDLILEDFAATALWHLDHQDQPHDEDFRVFRWYPGDDEVFLDAGANIGNSAISFRLFNRRGRIISFEPAPWLEPALRTLVAHDSRFSYHMVGLGKEETTARLLIPCLDRKPNLYLASIREERFSMRRREGLLRLMSAKHGQRFGVCAVETRIRPLDSFGLAPTILKADVEEAEADLLHGAVRTLREQQPLVLIEGSNRRPEVNDLMRSLGYRFANRDGDRLRLTDQPSSASNGFFVPQDRPCPALEP